MPCAKWELQFEGVAGCASSSSRKSSSAHCGVDEPPEAEAQLFWQALLPEDKQLVCRHVARSASAEEVEMKDRTEFARVARHCCDLALERDFFRPLAILSKLLPADISIDFLEISEDERLHYIAMYAAQSDFLRDAFHTKANGELVVKGTKDVPFPSTESKPPQHKYAAVFDPRPCFDVIRSSFLRPTSEAAEDKRREMFRILDELPDYGDRRNERFLISCHNDEG